jgi:hypothetical protein
MERREREDKGSTEMIVKRYVLGLMEKEREEDLRMEKAKEA